MKIQKRHIIIFFIIAVAAFFRVWNLSSIPQGLSTWEAISGNTAISALKTNDFNIYYPSGGKYGFFTLLQALALGLFGAKIWAVRIVSAFFGIATVYATYYFARHYVKENYVAMISAFLIAVSFWHVMISRIGIGEIMAPFFLTISLGLLYYTITRTELNSAAAVTASIAGGIAFGLGFYTYGAYAMAIPLLIPPLILFIKKGKEMQACTVCFFMLFVFAALVATSPLILNSINAQNAFTDFGQGIFSTSQPLAQLGSNAQSLFSLLFIDGDLRWAYNWPGKAQLWWLTSVFLAIGFLYGIKRRFWLWYLWLLMFSLPILFGTDAPSARNSIMLLPVLFLFAAFGIFFVWKKASEWLLKQELKYAHIACLIERIRKESFVLILIIVGAIAIHSFNFYFQKWAIMPQSAKVYSKQITTLANHITTLPQNTQKYIVVLDADSISYDERTPVIQPIMFLTNTRSKEDSLNNNLYFITRSEAADIDCSDNCLIFFTDTDHDLAKTLKEQIPGLALFKDNKIIFYTVKEKETKPE